MKSDPAIPQKIHERLQEMKEMHCEVVLLILNGVGEDIYKTVKYFGNHKLGIVTQWVRQNGEFSVNESCSSRCTDFAAIAKNINKLDMVGYSLYLCLSLDCDIFLVSTKSRAKVQR